MSMAERTTDEKDFYTQLMTAIEAGNTNRAVEMMRTLDGQQSQHEMLIRLTNVLDAALDVRGASTLDLDRARALMRARDRALELKQNLDLEHAYALEEAIDRARALYLNLDRATLINRTIIACLNTTDNGRFASTPNTQAAGSPLIALKSNSGRMMTIALVCALICIVVAWMLLVRR